ncbi:MAG TPA: hypothetical protein VFE90_17455, partial [Myxococcales bacterium]|nr:hypothetical protein [Myxococcales bacterium]
MAKKKWLYVAAGAVAAAALVSSPRVARAYKAWELNQRQSTILAAKNALKAGADGLPELSPLLADASAEQGEAEETDNAEIRRLVMEAEIGPRTPDAQKYLINLSAQERARWAAINAARATPGADAPVAPAASTPGTRNWENLGPLAARSEFNGTFYKGMDAGRPTAIAVHPGSPNLTFLATSGGGVWFGDLSSNFPFWQPITDNIGALAVGAIAIDPNFDSVTGQVTIWLGLGDAFDQQSGVLMKGTYTPGDAAGVWGTPVVLGTTDHPADHFSSVPLNIRQIRIDPTNSTHILVATDDGMYKSLDGGASFQIVDLPNDDSTGPTRENVWEIQFLGRGATGSQWVASGVYACPTLAGAKVGTRPPSAQAGSVACAGDPNAAHFNKGDFWKSIDGGATWTSIRAAGGLPAVVTQSLGTEVGRIAFAAGATSNPATTVLYAQAGTVQESSITGFTTATAAYMKSVDGGSTWTRIATGLTLTTPATTATNVTNPTILATDGSPQSGCTTMNLAHVQSWYNLTVAVDPGNSNRALFGGDLCSAVTVDGGATYQLASDWLPQSGLGFTNFGFLGYVHADWHTSLALRIDGLPVLLVGTDGGIFVSRNIWDVPTPELGSWSQPDVGLATHLFYGIGTGDPTLGNPNVVFGGLQDNGTRWRLISDENFIADFNTGNWDQILGGDGLGAAAVSDTNGQNQVYWISVNGTRRYCVPRMWDCSQATRIQNGAEEANWRNPGAAAADPFLIRYDTLGDDSSAVASASNTSARLWFIDPVSLVASVRTVVPGPITVDGTGRTIRGMGLRVSPYRYTIDGVANTRIYGGVTTSSTTAMGTFLAYDKPGVGATTVVGPHGVSFPGVTGLGTGTIWIGNGSDFAAPQNAASLGGTDSKLTWLVASNSVLSNAVGCGNPAAATCDPAVIIPPLVGHLYKTIDGGNTWAAFHGNGTGFDLPNVPVYVIRYEPTDTTDKTIW